MYKRFLAMILALVMIFSVISVYAEEDGTEITVYLSVSKYGEIVDDKDGNPLAYVPVYLSGESEYTLDDVFRTVHIEYYVDGADGYESSEGMYGFGVDKLWGDDSYNFGYQLNGGAEQILGLGHTVKQGDYIDAYIYKNLYPETEGYSKFNISTGEAYIDGSFNLVLSYVSGYDENWNTVFSPCEGAKLIINGNETEFITDENGQVTVCFENTGVNIISARLEKIIDEESVPAITAPCCVVDVKESKTVTIMHNIAAYYSESSFEEAGGNLPWIISDLAVYEELFPNSSNILTESRKEEALSLIVESASKATRPGDLAKYILALRALGYDAKNIYTKDFEKIDIVEKLTALVDSGDVSVTNIYTLPYVIIALSQGENYATEEQMNSLISSVLESKSAWQDASNGTDALTPMLLALAPYYDTNEQVKTIIDETVEVLKSEQREDGLIDGFEGYESASTGLAICGLSAVGIDSQTVENGGISLIKGLLSTANDELDGFPNAFATEQGFRGLLAWRLLSEDKGKCMFDFSDYSMKEVNVSGAEKCPVIFDVSPADAVVTIDGATELLKNVFDLSEGSYTYTVSASGYKTETGTVDVTATEEDSRIAKTVTLSLSKKYSGGGGGGGTVHTPDKDEKTETEVIEENNVTTTQNFSDVTVDDWYYTAVQYVCERDLFKGTDTGFEPEAPMTRAMLVTVLFRLAQPDEEFEENLFSDVADGMWYTDSINWAAEKKIVSGVSATEFAPEENITREQLAVIMYRYALLNGYDTSVSEKTDFNSYSDAIDISDYAFEGMRYAVGIGLINGREESTLMPKENITRAEVATILMRFAQVKERIYEEK